MARAFDPARFRRLVAGITLIAAPLCGIVWSHLVPPFTAGMEGEVAFISAHPGQWAVATYMGVVFSYLMIPAMLGLLHLVRTRMVVLGHIGGVLAATGAAFHGTMLGFQLVEPPIVQRAIDRGQAVAITSALSEQPVFTALVIPMLGLFLGLILLAIALWRARMTPWWVVVLIVVGVATELAGPPAVKARLLFLTLTVALGWLGVTVLRMTDAEWRRLAEEPAP